MKQKTLLDWYKDKLTKEGNNVSNFTDQQLTYKLGKSMEGEYGPQKIKEYPEFNKQYKSVVNAYKAEDLGRDGFFGGVKEIGAGIGQGIDETQGMLYGGAGFLAKKVGLDGASDYLMGKSMENMEESQVDAPTIQSYSEVNSFGEGLRYLSGGIGRVIPSGATMVGTGGIGGLIGKQVLKKAVVGPALKKYAKNLTKKGIDADDYTKSIGKRYAELAPEMQDIAKGYASGLSMLGTTTAASGTMGIGEVYSSLYPYTQLDKQDSDYVTPESAEALSWKFGLAIGALDSILPSMVGPKLLKKFFPGKNPTASDIELADNFVKQALLKQTAKGIVLEGGTEATQEYLNVVAEKFAHNEDSPFDLTEFSDQEIDTLIDGGILGMIGGATFSGATELAAGAKSQLADRKAEKEKKEELQNNLDAIIKAEAEKAEATEEAVAQIAPTKAFDIGQKVITKEGDVVEFKGLSGEDAVIAVKPNPDLDRLVEKRVPLKSLSKYEEVESTQEEEAQSPESTEIRDLIIERDYLTEELKAGASPEATMRIAEINKKLDDYSASQKTSVDNFREEKIAEQEGTKEGRRRKKKSEYQEEQDAKDTLREREVNGIPLPEAKAYLMLNELLKDETITSDDLTKGKLKDKEGFTEAFKEWSVMFYGSRNPGYKEFITAFKNGTEKFHGAGFKTAGDLATDQKKAEDIEKVAEAEKLKKIADEAKVKIAQRKEEVKVADRIRKIQGGKSEIFKVRSSDANYSQTYPELEIAYATSKNIGKPLDIEPISKKDWEKEFSAKNLSDKNKNPGTGKIAGQTSYEDYVKDFGILKSTLEANTSDKAKVDEILNRPKQTTKKTPSSTSSPTTRKKTTPTPEVEEVVEEIDGSTLDAIPTIENGKYVFIVGASKSILTVNNDVVKRGAKFKKERSDYNQLSDLVLSLEKPFDISEVITPSNQKIKISFDGVSVNYTINSEDNYQVVASKSKDEAKYIYGKEDDEFSSLEDPSTQTHVRVKDSQNFEGRTANPEEIILGTDTTKKYQLRNDLPNGTDTGSVHLVAIKHEKSGSIFVRSVKREKTEIKIAHLKRKTRQSTVQVNLGEEASSMSVSELPEGFSVYGSVWLSATKGSLRQDFTSSNEYETWLNSFKVLPIRETGQTAKRKIADIEEKANSEEYQNEVIQAYKDENWDVVEEAEAYFTYKTIEEEAPNEALRVQELMSIRAGLDQASKELDAAQNNEQNLGTEFTESPIEKDDADLFFELTDEVSKLENLSDSQLFRKPPSRASNFTSQGGVDSLWYLPTEVMISPSRTPKLKRQIKEQAKRLDNKYKLGIFEKHLVERQAEGFKGGIANEVLAMQEIFSDLKTKYRTVKSDKVSSENDYSEYEGQVEEFIKQIDEDILSEDSDIWSKIEDAEETIDSQIQEANKAFDDATSGPGYTQFISMPQKDENGKEIDGITLDDWIENENTKDADFPFSIELSMSLFGYPTADPASEIKIEDAVRKLPMEDRRSIADAVGRDAKIQDRDKKTYIPKPTKNAKLALKNNYEHITDKNVDKFATLLYKATFDRYQINNDTERQVDGVREVKGKDGEMESVYNMLGLEASTAPERFSDQVWNEENYKGAKLVDIKKFGRDGTSLLWITPEQVNILVGYSKENLQGTDSIEVITDTLNLKAHRDSESAKPGELKKPEAIVYNLLFSKRNGGNYQWGGVGEPGVVYQFLQWMGSQNPLSDAEKSSEVVLTKASDSQAWIALSERFSEEGVKGGIKENSINILQQVYKESDSSRYPNAAEATLHAFNLARTQDPDKAFSHLSDFTNAISKIAIGNDGLGSQILNAIGESTKVSDIANAIDLINDADVFDTTRTSMSVQLDDVRSLIEGFANDAIKQLGKKKYKPYALFNRVISAKKLKPSIYGIPQTKVEKDAVNAEEATDGISATGMPVIQNMSDLYLGDSTSYSIADNADNHNVTQSLKRRTNFEQNVILSEDQQARNKRAVDNIIGDNIFAPVVLEKMKRYVENYGISEESNEFLYKYLEVVEKALAGRDAPLSVIPVDNITSEPNRITRGNRVDDSVFINRKFHAGKNDFIAEELPFNFVEDKTTNVLMSVLMHEVWHGTMETQLRAHEDKVRLGQRSEIQETYDLIKDVISEIKKTKGANKFTFLFSNDQVAVSETLNYAWTRKDFAKFLSETKITNEGIKTRIDKNGKNLISTLMDALYSAYVKLLNTFGINTEGSALGSILELSRQLEAQNQALLPGVSIPPNIADRKTYDFLMNDSIDNSRISVEVLQNYKKDVAGEYLEAFEDIDDTSYVTAVITGDFDGLTPDELGYVKDSLKKLNPRMRNLLRALQRDDYLGFDTPFEAIDAILTEDTESLFSNFDMSPSLKSGITKYMDSLLGTKTKPNKSLSFPIGQDLQMTGEKLKAFDIYSPDSLGKDPKILETPLSEVAPFEKPEIVTKLPLRDLTRLAARDINWGGNDRQMDRQLANLISENTSASYMDALNEIDSLHAIFDATPDRKKERFKQEARDKGIKNYYGRGQAMEDSLDGGDRNPNENQTLDRDANEIAGAKMQAAATNELLASISESMEDIRLILNEPTLSVEDVIKKFFKGSRSPIKQVKQLVKNYDEAMADVTIESIKPNEGMAQHSRTIALRKVELFLKQSREALSANLDQLDPKQDKSLVSEITNLEKDLIVDPSVIFDRSNHGDNLSKQIKHEVQTARQETADTVIDDIDTGNSSLIQAFSEITESKALSEDFIDALKKRKGSYSSQYLSDLIFKVSKVDDIQALTPKDIYNIIKVDGKLSDNEYIIISSAINRNKDSVHQARLSSSDNYQGKRTTLKKLEDLSKSTIDQLKVIKGKNPEKSLLTGTKQERQILESFINKRISYLEKLELVKDIEKSNQVYRSLNKYLKVNSSRLQTYLHHSPVTNIVDGMTFPVMKKVEGEYQLSSIKVKLSNKMLPEDMKEFVEARQNNRDYLADPINEKIQATSDFEYIRNATAAADALTLQPQHREAQGKLNGWWLKSAQKMFGETGRLGKEIQQMELKFDIAYRTYVSQAKAHGRRWNRKLLNASQAWGYKNERLFLDQIYDKVLKWNEDQPQLNDKASFDSGTYEKALSLVPNKEAMTDNARQALRELLEQSRVVSSFMMEISKTLGNKVTEEGVKVSSKFSIDEDYEMQDLERDPIRRGYQTSGRKIRSEYVLGIVNELSGKGWADEESWSDVVEAIKDKNVTEEAKVRAMDAYLEIGVDEYVLDKFIKPYLLDTSVRGLLTLPGGGKVPRNYVVSAWEKSEGEGNKRFLSFIDALYESVPHKTDTSDYIGFKYGVIKAFNKRYQRLFEMVSDVGGANDNKAYALAHRLMDSRSMETIIPVEFLQYETYTEVDTQIHIAQIIGNSVYGRNADRLTSLRTQLEGELKDKRARLINVADMLGMTPPNSAPFKIKRGLRQRAAQLVEGMQDIPGETGNEKLKNLEAATNQLANFHKANKHLQAHLEGDVGPFKDHKLLLELLGTNAFLILNQPKSGLTNLLSLADQPLVYKGFNKFSRKALTSSLANVFGNIFGPMIEKTGLQLQVTSEYAQWLNDVYFKSSEHEVGFSDYKLNLGGSASKKASKLEIFKLDGLRQLKDSLQYTPVKKDQKYAPFALRTMFLNPFTYLGNLANHSLGVGAVNAVDMLVKQAADFIEQTGQRTGQPLPQTFQVTAENLGLEKKSFTGEAILGNESMFNYVNNAIEQRGLGTISDLAHQYIERKAKGKTLALTKDQAIAISTIALHDVAMEGGFTSRSAFWYTNEWAKYAAPLLSWSFSKVNQVNESVRNEQTSEVELQASIRALSVMALWLAPVGMAFTFGMDEYDEEILGKASSLRPISKASMIPIFGPFMAEGDAKSNALAMTERLARAGNIGGIAGDFFASIVSNVDPYTTQRGFSLDTRILGMATILNIRDALTNAHHSRSFDYNLVVRPLLYSMGGNSFMQTTQAASNLLGFDVIERRVSDMIGNRNKVRAALSTLDIERRPVGPGGNKATPFSIHIRKMEQAAYADDNKLFEDAYSRAIEASIERGDEDPEAKVLQSYKRRTLRSGISRYTLDDDEWGKILNVFTPEHSRSLERAQMMHEKYEDILKEMDDLNLDIPGQNFAPIDYEQLIKQSLSF